MLKYSIVIGLALAAMSLMCLAEANTIHVCADCDIAKINDAINKSISGDTIEVNSGVYSENISLNKRLVMRGIDTGDGKPVLDNNGKKISILINANGTTIEGFALRNYSYAGIEIISSHNVIKDNEISNDTNGIIVIQSTNNSLLNNRIISNKKTGVILSISGNNILIGNYVSNNTFGLQLISSNDNNISQNAFMYNKFCGVNILNSNGNVLQANIVRNNPQVGLSLENSLNNIFRQNKMFLNRYNFGANGNNDIDMTNLVEGKPIYYMIGAHNVKINQPSKAGTIYCINCSGITIENQLLTNNSAGIYLYNTTRSTIQNNYLNYNGKGIYLSDSRYNNITLDHPNSNERLIYVVQSSDNMIRINSTNTSITNFIYIDVFSEQHNNTLVNISPGPRLDLGDIYGGLWSSETNVTVDSGLKKVGLGSANKSNEK
jgi:parallel beta-helix repeat protein